MEELNVVTYRNIWPEWRYLLSTFTYSSKFFWSYFLLSRKKKVVKLQYLLSRKYTMSGKRRHSIFCSNFAKCWPIFKTLSPSDLSV